MNQQPNPHNHCPKNEEALFQGSFSAKLRELAIGSSRWDVLAAIRTAPLDAWTIDESNQTVALSLNTAGIRFTPGKSSPTWVSASTPHGDFSLDKDHWISQQIGRRLERRLEGYKLALQPDAQNALENVCDEVMRNEPHPWIKAAADTWAISVMAVINASFLCYRKSGLVLTVERSIEESYIPVEAAVSDLMRFESQQRYMSEQNGFNVGFNGFSGSSYHEAHCRPPISPGYFRSDYLTMQVQDPKLSHLSTALGFTSPILAERYTSAKSSPRELAVWKQAFDTVEASKRRGTGDAV